MRSRVSLLYAADHFSKNLHPLAQVFERKGIHLYTRLTITLLEALTGFKKTIKHLDGEEIAVERDAVTQPGRSRCCYCYHWLVGAKR